MKLLEKIYVYSYSTELKYAINQQKPTHSPGINTFV